MLGSTQLTNDMESADVAIAVPNLSVTFFLMLFIYLHKSPRNCHLLQEVLPRTLRFHGYRIPVSQLKPIAHFVKVTRILKRSPVIFTAST